MKAGWPFGGQQRIYNFATLEVTVPSCVEPDARPTVVVGGQDSGVSNRVADGACTVNDLILDEYSWPDHSTFVRYVDDVMTGLVSAGVITDREKGAIVRAAARTDVGKDG